MHNFFKNLLLYSQAYVRQTIYVGMMTKEGSDTQVTVKACGPLVIGDIFGCRTIFYGINRENYLLVEKKDPLFNAVCQWLQYTRVDSPDVVSVSLCTRRWLCFLVWSESGIGLGLSLIRKDLKGQSQIFIQDVYTGSPADKDGRLR